MEAFTPGRLALLIAALLFALYPGVLLGTHTLFNQDFGLFTYPVAHYARESFLHGEWPLWNPLSQCGVPFLAQWNTSACYPPSLIYLLLPLPWSLNFFCLAHIVLACMGMYRLASCWTQDRLAASVAGLGFAMSGLLLNSMLWTSNLAAMAWMPFVVLAVWLGWRGGGRRVAAAALAGAMQMLSGSPEVIAFTWFMLGALWLCEVAYQGLPLWPSLRRFAFIVGLVAGLAAVQILPFLELLAHSERASGYTQADVWPLPLWGWANFVVPQFHAAQSLMGTYHLHGQYWLKSYYAGIGILSLALAGIWRGRSLKIWWLAGAALLGLWLAFGNDGLLYAALKRVAPAIGMARYPVKFIVVPVFALPLLAAYGLSQLHNSTAENSRRGGRVLFAVGGLLGALTIVTLVTARQHPLLDESWSATWQSAFQRMFFLAGSIMAIVALGRARVPRTRTWLGGAVVVLVGLDLLTAAFRLHPTVAIKAFGPLELNMSARPRLGESRALVTEQAHLLLNRIGTPDPIMYCVGIRGALYQNSHLPEEIPKVDGFCSLRLKGSADVLSALAGGTNFVPSPMADFLGVAQVLDADNLFAWHARTNAMPLVTAGQRPVFASSAEIRSAITNAGFDPRQMVYLPTTARTAVTATNATPASISSAQWSAHRVRFLAEASAPALVVVAQSFYPNWHAFVDSRPVTLWQANHAFQALEVPAGRHEIALVYEDKQFHRGMVISILTLVVCGGLLFRRGGAAGQGMVPPAP